MSVPPGRTLGQNDGPETAQKLTPSPENQAPRAIWHSSPPGFVYTPALHKAAAAAKSLQSCTTLCDPIDGGPLSLGFSRQEHWSGLPFSSHMHESEKRK